MSGQKTDSSIFAQLEQRRQALVAQGREVTNLSIGTPDFEPDQHVMQAVAQAALRPENYRYAVNDLPQLKEAVQAWYQRRYGVDLQMDEIMSVYGSQEGIAHVSFPFIQRGDVVLAPDPGYPIFTYGPRMAGAEIARMPLLEEKDYKIDFDAIDPAVADRAKMMVVSYPANPVTATADGDFYERLVHFAKKHDILVVHDNAYSDLVLEGEPGISFLSIPGAKEVGVEFNSLSKTYNLTGARVSFCLGNREMIEKFQGLRSQIDYGMYLPVQYGAIAALTGPQDIVQRNRDRYRSRSHALCGGLRQIGWHVPDSKATMFVWAKIPAGFDDSVQFALELIDRAGFICVPGDSFGSLGKGYVRLALVADEEELARAIDRIDRSGMLRR